MLDGDRSYTQNKEANEQTRINHEQGQRVMYLWAPVKEGEVAKETRKCSRVIVFRCWPRRVRLIRISHGGRRSRKYA